MTPGELLQRFEDMHRAAEGATAGGAMVGLATWIARRQEALTADDLALLTAVGSVLFGKALGEHDGIVAKARASTEAIIEAIRAGKERGGAPAGGSPE